MRTLYEIFISWSNQGRLNGRGIGRICIFETSEFREVSKVEKIAGKT
jgi:intein/homing endonuclease